MSKTYPNRHSIRLKDYDYSQQGLYFITICTHNRKPLFGTIHDGEMILNKYGQIAYKSWSETEQIRPNVLLGNFVVMPNHFHAVFAINYNDGFRRGVLYTPDSNTQTAGVCNTQITGVCNTPLQSPSQTVGAIVRGYKSAVTKQIRQSDFDGHVWQRNYHEHIIRNKIALHRISQYIIENPVRWQDDCYYSG